MPFNLQDFGSIFFTRPKVGPTFLELPYNSDFWLPLALVTLLKCLLQCSNVAKSWWICPQVGFQQSTAQVIVTGKIHRVLQENFQCSGQSNACITQWLYVWLETRRTRLSSNVSDWSPSKVMAGCKIVQDRRTVFSLILQVSSLIWSVAYHKCWIPAKNIYVASIRM